MTKHITLTAAERADILQARKAQERYAKEQARDEAALARQKAREEKLEAKAAKERAKLEAKAAPAIADEVEKLYDGIAAALGKYDRACYHAHVRQTAQNTVERVERQLSALKQLLAGAIVYANNPESDKVLGSIENLLTYFGVRPAVTFKVTPAVTYDDAALKTAAKISVAVKDPAFTEILDRRNTNRETTELLALADRIYKFDQITSEKLRSLVQQRCELGSRQQGKIARMQGMLYSDAVGMGFDHAMSAPRVKFDQALQDVMRASRPVWVPVPPEAVDDVNLSVAEAKRRGLYPPVPQAPRQTTPKGGW